MEELVVAEHPGIGTGRRRIDHGTRRVARPRRRPGAEEPEDPDAVHDLGQRERATRPPERRRREPARSRIGALRQTSFVMVASKRTAPRDREEWHAPARMHDEQPDRRVGARDQRIDHRVVEPAHPKSSRPATTRADGKECRRRTSSRHSTRMRWLLLAPCRRARRVQGARRGEPRRRTPAGATRREAAASACRHRSSSRWPGLRAKRRRQSRDLRSVECSVRGLQLRPPGDDLKSPALQGAQLPELREPG